MLSGDSVGVFFITGTVYLSWRCGTPQCHTLHRPHSLNKESGSFMSCRGRSRLFWMFDNSIGCFTPVASDRLSRSLVEIECLPGSKFPVERDYFLECFSHLKTPMRRKKKSPTFLECQACYRDTAKTVRSVMIPQLFRRCHQDAAA